MINKVSFTSNLILKSAEGSKMTPEAFIKDLVERNNIKPLETFLNKLKLSPDEDTIELSFEVPGKDTNNTSVTIKYKDSEGINERDVKPLYRTNNIKWKLEDILSEAEDQANLVLKKIADIKADIKNKFENVEAGNKILAMFNAQTNQS